MFSENAETIVELMRSTISNARELVGAASQLIQNDHHAPAFSISVLALEEIGKMMLIDGLANARQGDDRSEGFYKGRRSHRTKLIALDMMPFFLNYIASIDDRFSKDKRFKQTLVIVIRKQQRFRQDLMPWLGEDCDLAKLDQFKQHGFYSNLTSDGDVTSPSTLIDKEFANGVFKLADSVTDSVWFFFRENFEKYQKLISAIRTVDKELLKQIRDIAELQVEEFFEETMPPKAPLH